MPKTSCAYETEPMSPLDGAEGNGFEPSDLYTHTGSAGSAFGAAVERSLWKFRARIEAALYGNPLYPFFLVGKTPRRLEATPADPWPGDRKRGEAILDRAFPFLGVTVRADPSPWQVEADPRWLAELHGFAWLRDLRAIGSDAARRRARELVVGWVEANRAWHPVGWRADVLGTRLASWVSHGEFLCAGAEDRFRKSFLAALGRQVRHLLRTAPGILPGPARIAVAKGLIYAGAALPTQERALQAGLHLLERELPRQVHPDGGHVSRSPAVQLAMLRDLAEIRLLLHAMHREVPNALQTAMDRLGVLLRFFRHGDGRLTLFNGACEEEGWLIDMVLTRAEVLGNPPRSAPYSGFERLRAGRTLVLFDTGVPASVPPGNQQPHAGTLSFEMSSGKERLVVNCGAYVGGQEEWREIIRSTAAHSTVTVDDKNSSQIASDGKVRRRPSQVLCRRDERDGNVWVEGSHDGYRAPLGLIHRRRLYLAANGEDLRGEDRLEGLGGSRFDVRFHLHPGVSASLAQDGFTVLLRLPKGEGWKFHAIGGDIHLEKSVYLGERGKMQRSEQIVVSGMLAESAACVKWAFRRLPTQKPA